MPPRAFRRALVCAAVGISLALPVRPAAADAPQPDLNAIAQKAFDRGLTPGMAVAVVRNGALVFEQGYGFANIAKKTPVTPQTPFAIGSMTKQFTAVATLMLAQSDKLSLDDLIGNYIPILPHGKTITLQNLLWQTSGLHNYPLLAEHDWPLEGPIEPKTLFAIMATDKPDFEPGSKWEYSNTNYSALAGIVADVSGTPYGPFLRSRIFGPLAMNASGYGYRAQQTLPLATAYQGKTFGTYPQTLSLDLAYGAGGVVSSAHDVSLWMRGLMANALLDPAHTKLLWSPGHLSDGTPTQYAMGFVPSALDGHPMVWHNGFTPTDGGYCYDAIFPEDGIGVVVLTNSDVQTVQGMPESLTRAIFEAMVPPG